MNLFRENEFKKLCERVHAEPHTEDVIIRYFNSSFFNQMKKSIRKDRRGEVVFCVLRPSGSIITITCSEYPANVYRIPTGGIQYNEDILEAVYRETREELGLDVELLRFAGVLKLRFEHDDEFTFFYSYLFILKEAGGRLLLDASDDEISEVREVDLEGLGQVVESLTKITGKWSDWGKFRYVTSNAVLRYLKENARELGLEAE